MVKQKNTYFLDALERREDMNRVIYDPQQMININNVKNYLSQYITNAGIPAVMNDDVFSYKTGFMKTESVPCIVISNNQSPNDFKKFVFTIFYNAQNNSSQVNLSWTGESKYDKLVKKYEKAVNKDEKMVYKANNRETRYSLTDEIGQSLKERAAIGLNRKKIGRTEKKLEERELVEVDYYAVIRTMAFNVIAQLEDAIQ